MQLKVQYIMQMLSHKLHLLAYYIQNICHALLYQVMACFSRCASESTVPLHEWRWNAKNEPGAHQKISFLWTKKQDARIYSTHTQAKAPDASMSTLLREMHMQHISCALHLALASALALSSISSRRKRFEGSERAFDNLKARVLRAQEKYPTHESGPSFAQALKNIIIKSRPQK
jgi:hypothetical protein